jgi:hypothetical protein
MPTAKSPAARRGGSRPAASRTRTAQATSAATKAVPQGRRRARTASASADVRATKAAPATTKKAAARKATAQKPATTKPATTKPATTKPATTKAAGGRSIAVPLLNVRVPVLAARVPGADMAKRQTMAAADVVRSYLPPMERMAYYGGLGVAALVGVLEWPVAAAAGAGVWVATRTRRTANRTTAG